MTMRDRANIVCVQCHSRKVKCDLQSSPDTVCKHCRRSNQTCVPRRGVRKKRQVGPRQDHGRPQDASPTPCRTMLNSVPERSLVSPRSSVDDTMRQCNSPHTSLTHQLEGFIAHSSVLACDIPPDTAVAESPISESSRFRHAILMATQADVLPDPTLFQALMDSFSENVFHQYPIVEQTDLSRRGSCILLEQALCLAGSLMRHGDSTWKLSYLLYEKVKTLVAVNYEKNYLQVLKTLCLMSCWSATPPDQLGLDGPWHWTGVATRLAIQMGIHDESTYAKSPNAACLRRIFWHLSNSDKLQVACWGRPPLLKLEHQNVKALTLDDFEIQNTDALVFIQATKICQIIGKIADLNLQKRSIQPEELAKITAALCDWIRELPQELQLHDVAGNRRPFHRPTSELFIEYFVAIILSQTLVHIEGDRQWRTSVLSIIASSCIVRLYEEIYYRELAVGLIPIHGFFCMTTALPLIYYRPTSSVRESFRQEQIGIIRSIMTKMRGRYGGADMILRRIDKLHTDVTASTRRDECPPTFVATSQQLSEHASDMFPFPPSMCEDMELLGLNTISHGQFVTDNLVPLEGELDTFFLSDQRFLFMDMMDMNFDAFHDIQETQTI